MSSKCHPDVIQKSCKCHPDVIQMSSKGHPNVTKGHPNVIKRINKDIKRHWTYYMALGWFQPMQRVFGKLCALIWYLAAKRAHCCQLSLTNILSNCNKYFLYFNKYAFWKLGALIWYLAAKRARCCQLFGKLCKALICQSAFLTMQCSTFFPKLTLLELG